MLINILDGRQNDKDKNDIPGILSRFRIYRFDTDRLIFIIVAAILGVVMCVPGKSEKHAK